MSFNFGKRFGFDFNKESKSKVCFKNKSKYYTSLSRNNWLSPNSVSKSSQIPFFKRSGQSSSKNKKTISIKNESNQNLVKEILVNDNNCQKTIILNTKRDGRQVSTNKHVLKNLNKFDANYKVDEKLFIANSFENDLKYYGHENLKSIQPWSLSSKNKIDNDLKLINFTKLQDKSFNNLKNISLEAEKFKQTTNHKDNYGYITIEEDGKSDIYFNSLNQTIDSNYNLEDVEQKHYQSQFILNQDLNQCNQKFSTSLESSNCQYSSNNSNSFDHNQEIVKLKERRTKKDAERNFLNNSENENKKTLPSPTFLRKLKIKKDLNLPTLDKSSLIHKKSPFLINSVYSQNDKNTKSSSSLLPASSICSQDYQDVNPCNNFIISENQARREKNPKSKVDKEKIFQNYNETDHDLKHLPFSCSKKFSNDLKNQDSHFTLGNVKDKFKSTSKSQQNSKLIIKSDHNEQLIASSFDSFIEEKAKKLASDCLNQKPIEYDNFSNESLLKENESILVSEFKKSNSSSNHHFNDKLMQYHSCIAALEKKNNMLLRKLENLEKSFSQSEKKVEEITNINNKDNDKSETLNQIMLEKLKLLEQKNSNLLLEREKQRLHYEKCLNDVANQVVKALLVQKNSREECVQLHNRIRELEHENQTLNLIFRQHLTLLQKSNFEDKVNASKKSVKLPTWPTLESLKKSSFNHQFESHFNPSIFMNNNFSISSSTIPLNTFESNRILNLNRLNTADSSVKNLNNSISQSTFYNSSNLNTEFDSSDKLEDYDLVLEGKGREETSLSDISKFDTENLQETINSIKKINKVPYNIHYSKSPSSEAALHLIKDCLSKSENKSSKSVEMLESQQIIDRPPFSSFSKNTYCSKQTSQNISSLFQPFLSQSQSNQTFSNLSKINPNLVFCSSSQPSTFNKSCFTKPSSSSHSNNNLNSSKFSSFFNQPPYNLIDSSQSTNQHSVNLNHLNQSHFSFPAAATVIAENNGESTCKDEGYSTMSSDVQNDVLQTANLKSNKLFKSLRNPAVCNFLNSNCKFHRDLDFTFDKMAVLREEENEGKESETESTEKNRSHNFDNNDNYANKEISSNEKLNFFLKSYTLNNLKKSNHHFTFPTFTLFDEPFFKQSKHLNLHPSNRQIPALIKTTEKENSTYSSNKEFCLQDSAKELLTELSNIIAPCKIRLRCQPCFTFDSKKSHNEIGSNLKSSLLFHIVNANYLLRCMYRSSSDSQLYYRKNEKPVKLFLQREECFMPKNVKKFIKVTKFKTKKLINFSLFSNKSSSSSVISDELDFYVTPYFRRFHSKSILEEISNDDKSDEEFDVDYKKFVNHTLHSENTLRWDDSEVTWKLNDPFLTSDNFQKLYSHVNDKCEKFNCNQLIDSSFFESSQAEKNELEKKKNDNSNCDSVKANEHVHETDTKEQKSNLNEEELEMIPFNRDFYRLCSVGSNKSITNLQNEVIKLEPNLESNNKAEKETEKLIFNKKFAKPCAVKKVNKFDCSTRNETLSNSNINKKMSAIDKYERCSSLSNLVKKSITGLDKGPSSNLPLDQKQISLSNKKRFKKEKDVKLKLEVKSNLVKSSSHVTKIPQPKYSISSDELKNSKEKVKLNLVLNKQDSFENKTSKCSEMCKSASFVHEDLTEKNKFSSQSTLSTNSFSDSYKTKLPLNSKISKENSNPISLKSPESNVNINPYRKSPKKIPTAEELEKRILTAKSISKKIKELNSLFKDEDPLKNKKLSNHLKGEKKTEKLNRKVLSRKEKKILKSKEGHETSWVHLSSYNGSMLSNLDFKKEAHSTSDSSSDDETTEAKQLYQHLHALHKFRRQKKRANERDMVISFVPRSRVSIVDRHDFYYRFGEKEQEAVACFDFLENLAVSKNSSDKEANCTNSLPTNDSSEDERFLLNIYLSSLKNYQINQEVVSQDNDMVSNCFDAISLSDSCANSCDGYEV